MFEDFENEVEDSEVVEHIGYRVYGGDSTLEGGFITNEKPKNPIQARADLGLSQHFTNEDGEITRNLANRVATVSIKTTTEGEVINKEGEPTGDPYVFTPVATPEGQEPAGYQPGGGQEYELKRPFNEVVTVVDDESLIHLPTPGWQDYIDKEKVIIENASTEEPSSAVENEPPVETVEEDSSAETVEDVAPVETVEEVTPVETIEEVTPVETVEEDSSAETIEDVAPVETVEEVTPVETVEEVTPVETVEEDSSAETVEDAAPVESVEDAAPVETIEEVTPVESVEDVAPVETIEENNDNSSDKKGSNEYDGWEY